MTIDAHYASDHTLDLESLADSLSERMHEAVDAQHYDVGLAGRLYDMLKSELDGTVVLQLQPDEISHAAPTLPSVASLCGDKRRVG